VQCGVILVLSTPVQYQGMAGFILEWIFVGSRRLGMLKI
jgi:hypothetical protein